MNAYRPLTQDWLYGAPGTEFDQVTLEAALAAGPARTGWGFVAGLGSGAALVALLVLALVAVWTDRALGAAAQTTGASLECPLDAPVPAPMRGVAGLDAM